MQQPSNYPTGPRVANAHLFRAGDRHMLFSVSRGEVYEVDEILAQALDRTMAYGDADRLGQFMSAAGILDLPVDDEPPESVRLNALSLAVAQKCNLGCTYCYAQQGNFGGQETTMTIEVAKTSIDRLLEQSSPGQKVSIAYLGGEPLTGRSVLQESATYAASKAAAAGVGIDFAITTNATLLNEADVEFFERYRFAITISIDGTRETHNKLRPFKSGQGSYDRVLDRARLLLCRSDRRCPVRARVTVTPQNLELAAALEELVQLGFDGVLFSPALSSPNGTGEMSGAHLDSMLAQLIECGRLFEDRMKKNELYPFLNVINTVQRIGLKKRDLYPCGAGGGYMGVSSKGDLYACHRFVGEEVGAMGSVNGGVDSVKQASWLRSRSVRTQEPCKTCWARYLCSGGCHHETIHRGRPACDYIRGWLHYCLGLYATLRKDHPSLLERILHPQ